MEEQNKSSSNQERLLKGIEHILKTNILLECEMETMKRIFQVLLSQMDPNMPLTAHEEAYRRMRLVVFENKMKGLKETAEIYSDEMTEQLRSELSDLPGIILPSLR